jgi:hypothetical protein
MTEKEILVFPETGEFAENKDTAQKLRTNQILPALDAYAAVILNFEKVEGVTQSFVHALISEIIRKKGLDVLDRIYFKNCNTTVKKMISIVVDYMQDNWQS